MTLHFPDQVMTNFLTIHATDPKSGTAEFKASAVRIEPALQATSRSSEAAIEQAAAERVAIGARGASE
jgi:formate dehydrogenase major subunit